MAFIPALIGGIGSAISSGLGALASVGGSTLFQVGGALLSGFGTLAEGVYQSNVAKNNAAIAAENAQKESDATQQRVLEQDQQTAALVGEQTAVQGASGLSGRTQELTRKSAQTLGRQDAANVNQSGANSIAAYLQQEADYKSSAQSSLFSGVGGALSSFFKAGSLVGAAPKIARPNRFIPTPTDRPRYI
jgi:hypothetical protein